MEKLLVKGLSRCNRSAVRRLLLKMVLWRVKDTQGRVYEFPIPNTILLESNTMDFL